MNEEALKAALVGRSAQALTQLSTFGRQAKMLDDGEALVPATVGRLTAEEARAQRPPPPRPTKTEATTQQPAATPATDPASQPASRRPMWAPEESESEEELFSWAPPRETAAGRASPSDSSEEIEEILRGPASRPSQPKPGVGAVGPADVQRLQRKLEKAAAKDKKIKKRAREATAAEERQKSKALQREAVAAEERSSSKRGHERPGETAVHAPKKKMKKTKEAEEPAVAPPEFSAADMAASLGF